MNRRLEYQIRFLLEADRLKEIQRRSYLLSGRRLENSAEHSWHLALMSMTLAEHANTEIDALKVLRMLIVHDLVEIDAGDTFCYDTAGNASKAEREQKAAERLFGLLPGDQGREMRRIWDEFEAGATVEARFAAAMDRLMPVLHNLHSKGRSWREHSVTAAQVFARNEKIAEGSETLWMWVKAELDRAVQEGVFEHPDRVAEMQDYYRKRAPVYDQSMGYHQAEVIERQRPVIDFLGDALTGRTVLEIACGPCFWTHFVAGKAKAVLATDFNEATLDEARRKFSGPSCVTLQVADAYSLPQFDRRFDAGLAVDWFCHVPLSKRLGFIEGLHRQLEPGARVIFCDQLPKKTPAEFDTEGNHLQERALPDGSRHTVIKNFPTEAEMRELLAPYAGTIEYRTFPEARRWVVSYTLG